jgi:hypothetical protein
LRDAQIPGHRLPLQRQRRQHPDRDHRPQLQPHLRRTPLRHPRRLQRPPTSGNSSSRPPPSDWTSPSASSPGADSASPPRTGCPRCRRRSHNSYPRADSEEASTGPPASAGYRWLDGGPGTWVMPRPRTARAVRRKDQVSPIRGEVPCSSVRRLRGGRICRVTPPRMTQHRYPRPVGIHERGRRSKPANGSRMVTLEVSPSVCAAAEIVWIRSSVRFP